MRDQVPKLANSGHVGHIMLMPTLTPANLTRPNTLLPPRPLAEQGPMAMAVAVEDGKGATTFAQPGGLAVSKMGKGLVVIDQLLWDNPKVRRRRANWYLAGLLKNLGYFAADRRSASGDKK